MNQVKAIKQYLTYQERYYYNHTHLLANEYHKGKYDMIVKLIEFLDDFKHVRATHKKTLNCLKGGKNG